MKTGFEVSPSPVGKRGSCASYGGLFIAAPIQGVPPARKIPSSVERLVFVLLSTRSLGSIIEPQPHAVSL